MTVAVTKYDGVRIIPTEEREARLIAAVLKWKDARRHELAWKAETVRRQDALEVATKAKKSAEILRAAAEMECRTLIDNIASETEIVATSRPVRLRETPPLDTDTDIPF